MLAQVDSKNFYYALSVEGEKKWSTKRYQDVELSENLDERGS